MEGKEGTLGGVEGGPPTDGADLGERATSPLGALLAAAEVDGQWVTPLFCQGGVPPVPVDIVGSMARDGGGKNATDPALKQNNKTAGATPNIPDKQATLERENKTRTCLVPTVNSLFVGAHINMRGASIVDAFRSPSSTKQ